MVNQAQAQSPGRCQHPSIATENTVATRFGRPRQIVKTLQATAEPVPGLQDRDPGALTGQYRGGVQTSEPGADHDYVGLRGGAHGVGPADRGPGRRHAQSLERVSPADESSHE